MMFSSVSTHNLQSIYADIHHILLIEKHLAELSALLDVAKDQDDNDGGILCGVIATSYPNAILPFEIGVDTTTSSINTISTGGGGGATASASAAIGKQFILCPYNHDANSGMYRSPWSNSFFLSSNENDMELKEKEVAVVSGAGVHYPSHSNDQLRSLEIYANEMFDIYRTLYYGKGKVVKEDSVCSVYLWENNVNITRNNSSNSDKSKKDDGNVDATMDEESTGEDQKMKESSHVSLPGFGGCILIQNRDYGDKINNSSSRNDEIVTAYWNSIHDLKVSVTKKADMSKRMGSIAKYEITSTILLSVTTSLSRTAAATAAGSDTTAGAAAGSKNTTRTITKSTELCGSLTRHTVHECNCDGDILYDRSHIHNIGKYIEEIESHMRSELDALYLSRLQTTVIGLRVGTEKVCPLDGEGRGQTKFGGTSGTMDYAAALKEAVLARAMSTQARNSDD